MLLRLMCAALCTCSTASCTANTPDSALVIPLSEEGAISRTSAPGLATRLTVNGRSAWFVFDTGAGTHTFARWFVDTADLEVDSTARPISARDATGSRVELALVRDQVATFEDGEQLVIGAAVVAAFPEEFESASVGGLLNPQLLADEQNGVVLDLRIPELRVEPFDDAVRRLGAARLADDEMKVCRFSDVPIPNMVFSFMVRANGREGWLQLDTGSGVTVVHRESALVEGVTLGPGGASRGIAGMPQDYEVAAGLDLQFGEHLVVTNAHVVASTGRHCGEDGLLGLDAVGRCALVLSRDAVAVACP